MTTTPRSESLAARLQAAYANRDLGAFEVLLADDVRWGEGDFPRACHSRAEVLQTYGRLMSEGVEAEIVELAEGTAGLVCRLSVRWPEGAGHERSGDLYHLYRVGDGRIVEIVDFDDRDSAAGAAGLDALGR